MARRRGPLLPAAGGHAAGGERAEIENQTAVRLRRKLAEELHDRTSCSWKSWSGVNEWRECVARLERARPRADRPVLLSPFDPLLWDRGRVQQLFGLAQALEIFKPASHREFGYYCLPVLAGERLVGRVDLKARPAEGRLEVLGAHHEEESAATREAVRAAIDRYANTLRLAIR